MVRILDEGSDSDGWRDAEKFWIRFYVEEVGSRLTNATSGGDGTPGRVWSEEKRKQISDALKGKKHSEERRKKVSEAKKGIRDTFHTDETRAKMSRSRTGLKWSPIRRERYEQRRLQTCQ